MFYSSKYFPHAVIIVECSVVIIAHGHILRSDHFQKNLEGMYVMH